MKRLLLLGFVLLAFAAFGVADELPPNDGPVVIMWDMKVGEVGRAGDEFTTRVSEDLWVSINKPPRQWTSADVADWKRVGAVPVLRLVKMLPKPKVGDKIKVEMEGTILKIHPHEIEVRVDGGTVHLPR